MQRRTHKDDILHLTQASGQRQGSDQHAFVEAGGHAQHRRFQRLKCRGRGQDQIHRRIDIAGRRAVVEQPDDKTGVSVTGEFYTLSDDGHGPVAAGKLIGVRDRFPFVESPYAAEIAWIGMVEIPVHELMETFHRDFGIGSVAGRNPLCQFPKFRRHQIGDDQGDDQIRVQRRAKQRWAHGLDEIIPSFIFAFPHG